MEFLIMMWQFKFIAIVLLGFCLTSKPAHAQLWDYIITSVLGDRYYLDPLTIQRNGNFVNYVQLTNFPEGYQERGKTVGSLIQYKMSNCETGKIAVTRAIAYERENAKGGIVSIDMYQRVQWVTITPGKIADILHQEACNTRG